jgi:hypothetical protein
MSVLDQWQNRWEFAAYNHEQRFQTALVTKRRLFNAIINYPLTQIQNDLLRPDLIERDATGKKIRKIEFDAAAWRFIDDVVIGAGGGQFIRSFLFAYGSNKDFRDVHNASRALEGFGMSAETFDSAPKKLSEEIKAGRDHAVYDLVNHSAEASELLDKFVHGKLEVSPSNVAKLQRHLTAMSALCEEKADLREAYDSIRDPEARAKAEARGDSNDASGYIRDVIRLDGITTPRQAQILSGFVAALMVDAAKPLGTEMYIPQNDIFMPPEDAVKLSEFISQQMEHRGYVPNVSLAHKERPFPDMPEGAMVREIRDARTGEVKGYDRLSQADTMAFANAVHGYIKTELGSKIENMLRYVDKHFDEIEDSISRSQEDPMPAPIPVWDKQTAKSAGADKMQNRIRNLWEKSRHVSPLDMAKGAGLAATTAYKHLTRPEARFENQKLFGRAIAGQLVSYPVKIIDEALKSFLRPGKGLDKLIGASKTGVLEGSVFDREDFDNNLKSSTFRLFTAPLAASFGTVFSQELYHLPKGLAIEASGRAKTVLDGAIKTAHRHAPEVVARLKAMQDSHPALQQLMQKPEYKNNLPAIAAKKPNERSEQDYQLLAGYYNELSEICLSMAEEALSPFGVEVAPDKISSMDEVVTRVLRKPAENMADAMIALAYVQTFVDINAEKTASMEYVDPTQLLIRHGELRALGDFVETQAKAAGLQVAKGGEVEGVEAGELLEQNPETQKLQPASEATLIRYANVVTEELKKYVDIDNLLYAVKGRNSAEYLGKIENSLFAPTHFRVAGNQDATLEDQLAANTPVSEDLTANWQEKVKRKSNSLLSNIKQNLDHPEVQHEVRKLLGRSKGEAVSAFMPGLIYNSLQHNESIFSRSGLYSAAFKTAVYPLLYSKGLVTAKEAINETFIKRRHIINETNLAQNLLTGAIRTSGALDDGLREKLVASNQIHADMLALEKKDEYKDIPRIAAKPRVQRNDSDNALMKRFCEEIGSKMVDNSARIFSALNAGQQGEAVEQVMERAIEKPVTTLADAVITMGFMHSMLGANAHNLDVLTFVSPDDKVLDRKALQAMSTFMNDQAANAGFAIHGVPVQGKNGNEFIMLGADDSLREGELLQWNEKNKAYERAPAEAVIRYANVVMGKFRELVGERAEKDGADLVEKYKANAKEGIFKHLKAPAKEPEQGHQSRLRNATPDAATGVVPTR